MKMAALVSCLRLSADTAHTYTYARGSWAHPDPRTAHTDNKGYTGYAREVLWPVIKPVHRYDTPQDSLACDKIWFILVAVCAGDRIELE